MERAAVAVLGLLVASVTPGLAQPPVGLSLSADYVRAYGGGGLGPEMGVVVAIPGRFLGAHPSVGATVTAADMPLAGPTPPIVNPEGRRLRIITGRSRLEWPVARRFRVHGAVVLGVVESEVGSGLVLLNGEIRPANRVGRNRGLAVGVEGGLGIVLMPGALLEIAVAGLDQRAYAEDPVLMPIARLGIRVVPSGS